MKIIKKSQFSISNWSGGTTTQIYIYPENTSLDNRDFEWRISSAIVEKEETEFTIFEGYERILIPLTGSLEMIHQTPTGELRQNTSKFELARFSGDWRTKGIGKLTDFNFIFKSNIHAKIECVFLEKNSLVKFENNLSAFYLFEGSIEIMNELIEAPIFITDIESDVFEFIARKDCNFIGIQFI